MTRYICVVFRQTAMQWRRVSVQQILTALTGAAIVVVAACSRGERRRDVPFEVVATFPHDSSAYTQGLVWDDGVLYESTGQYGHSDVRRVDWRTGRVLASRKLGPDRFGEGLALLNGRLFQLTWKEGIAYTYDASSLAPRDSFHY